MTDSEQFKEAYDYLESLDKWVWHDFKIVPEPICQKVFQLIDTNGVSSVRITWMEGKDDYFIVTVPSEMNIQHNDTGCSN